MKCERKVLPSTTMTFTSFANHRPHFSSQNEANIFAKHLVKLRHKFDASIAFFTAFTPHYMDEPSLSCLVPKSAQTFWIKKVTNVTFPSLSQESRKIVNAEMQSIVYGQFLPEILSVEMLDKFGLRLNKGSTYFPEANPTLRNEFSTAANRYGHSQVQV